MPVPKYTVTITMKHRSRTVEHAFVERFELTEGFLVLHKAHGHFGFPLCDIESYKMLETR